MQVSIKQIQTFIKEGAFKSAHESITAALQVKGGENDYLYHLQALTFSKEKNFVQAYEAINKAILLNDQYAEYFADRGLIIFLNGGKKECITDFDQAQSLEPNNPYRYSSRAFIKDRCGDYTGAIEDYNKAIILDPEDAVSYNNRGLIEQKLGYMKKSTHSFKKADDLADSLLSKDTPTLHTRESKKRETTKTINIKDKKAMETQSNMKTLSIEQEKSRLKHYMKTFSQVFTKKKVFEEFIDFSKGFIGMKNRKGFL